MYPSGFQQKCIFREKVNEQIGEINRLFMRLQLFGIQDRKLIKGFNKPRFIRRAFRSAVSVLRSCSSERKVRSNSCRCPIITVSGVQIVEIPAMDSLSCSLMAQGARRKERCLA